MSTRITRSRARSETPQTAVTDFFKTTKSSRVRGEKKIIEENETIQKIAPPKKIDTIVEVQPKLETESVKINAPEAPVFEKKVSRVRNRTPSRQVELSTPEVTGTPPKKSKETVVTEDVPVLSSETNIVLESEKTEKSAIDVLMEAVGQPKKTKKVRTVTDLQARLAEKGAARAIHGQNLKNKVKQVEEHADRLKSPKKMLVDPASPVKSKAARSLFSPKKLPDYVLPGYNVQKSAEKIREEQDEAHDKEANRMTSEFLKSSRLTEEVKRSVRERIELPSSYELLASSFKTVDQIIAFKQGRSIGASELFKSVQRTSGREFSEVHLAQILHVYPKSYNVEMVHERNPMDEGSKYELKIRANLFDDLHGYIVEKTSSDTPEELPLVRPTQLLSPKKSSRKTVVAAPRAPEVNDRIRLDAARQRDRAHVFRHHLTGIVTQYRTEFLESRGLSDVPIERVHMMFSPNKYCPPLPQQTLPEAPMQKLSHHIGAKEAMERCIEAEQVKLPSSIQALVNDLKSPVKTMTGGVPLSPKKFTALQNEQKSSGQMSLIERIRAKEAAKKAADACIDPKIEKRKQRLQLIRTQYARVVCNHFTSKKAQSMELEAVAKFVQFSSSVPSSIPDIIENLRLMCEVAPMYITEVVLMNKKYLRFTDKNLEAICELLDEEIQKMSQQMKDQRSLLTPRPAKPAARKLVV